MSSTIRTALVLATFGALAFAPHASAQSVVLPGVDLAGSPARPLLYAEEIVASEAQPVTLLNPVGAQNLRVPLGYSFSEGEVRHVRMECTAGMEFVAGSDATYTGGGSADVGSINGLGSSVITFSLTANDNDVIGTDVLSITGARSITGTSVPVDCTYSLYDLPSQAQAGGAAGRVATRTGRYLDFGPSTRFESTPRTSIVDVETLPRYTRFLSSAPTTNVTAALARLTYGLTATPGPVPLSPAGTPVTLAELHAPGTLGTRIVVEGDFSAVADEGGGYSAAALDRVFLSTGGSHCDAVGLAASSVSATVATFDVGDTAHDRMLCMRPRSGVEIPESVYTARLVVTPAQPIFFRPGSLGPVAAGAIVHDGIRLQAPFVQLLDGWISRIALTNTGGTARTYSIRALSEPGVTLETIRTEGTVPANGTRVIDLTEILRTAGPGVRGTLVVTVNGPNDQVQGLYQIVNPARGSLSNQVMVRPDTN